MKYSAQPNIQNHDSTLSQKKNSRIQMSLDFKCPQIRLNLTLLTTKIQIQKGVLDMGLN